MRRNTENQAGRGAVARRYCSDSNRRASRLDERADWGSFTMSGEPPNQELRIPTPISSMTRTFAIQAPFAAFPGIQGLERRRRCKRAGEKGREFVEIRNSDKRFDCFGKTRTFALRPSLICRHDVLLLQYSEDVNISRQLNDRALLLRHLLEVAHKLVHLNASLLMDSSSTCCLSP